jgi:hypothetical protein
MTLPMSGFSPYMPTDTVDDTAGFTEMQGPSSRINQLAGQPTWASSPTKSLVALWLLVLVLYWVIGWLFRGQRS